MSESTWLGVHLRLTRLKVYQIPMYLLIKKVMPTVYHISYCISVFLFLFATVCICDQHRCQQYFYELPRTSSDCARCPSCHRTIGGYDYAHRQNQRLDQQPRLGDNQGHLELQGSFSEKSSFESHHFKLARNSGVTHGSSWSMKLHEAAAAGCCIAQ